MKYAPVSTDIRWQTKNQLKFPTWLNLATKADLKAMATAISARKTKMEVYVFLDNWWQANSKLQIPGVLPAFFRLRPTNNCWQGNGKQNSSWEFLGNGFWGKFFSDHPFFCEKKKIFKKFGSFHQESWTGSAREKKVLITLTLALQPSRGLTSRLR